MPVISGRLWLIGITLLGLGWLVVMPGCMPGARGGSAVPAPPTPTEQEILRQMDELKGSLQRLEEQMRQTNAELGAQLEEVQEEVTTVSVKVGAQERLLGRAAAAMSSFGRTAGGPGAGGPLPTDAGAGIAGAAAGTEAGMVYEATPGPLAGANTARLDAGRAGEAVMAGGAAPAAMTVELSAAAGESAGVLQAREASDLNEPPQAGEPGTAIPEPSEEGQRLYETAYSDLQRENFQLALINFRAFLADFPQSQLSDNAQYWIGEAHYAQGQFNQAIEEFRKVIDEHPGQDKVAAAYYKIALCFINLRDTVTARRYLTYVLEHYPSTNEARLAEEKLAAM
jgi:tol-pal system protein YbgF